MTKVSRFPTNGFALPMTIIAVAGLTLLLIGLLGFARRSKAS